METALEPTSRWKIARAMSAFSKTPSSLRAALPEGHDSTHQTQEEVSPSLGPYSPGQSSGEQNSAQGEGVIRVSTEPADHTNGHGVPVEGEDIPMAKVYHQLINLTNKPPSLRTNEELEELVPWLRKKSSHLFLTLEDHKIKKILKEAEFRRYRFDDVIIRQGDIGTEFFILVSGSVSFFVNSTDDLETMVQKQKQEELLAKEQGRPVNREAYGTHVGAGGEGKTFGELALIYPDCVRNATVISTNIYSDVLVVSKDMYDETLSGHQSRDHDAKKKFVQDCPLFHKWNPKYRKMAAMSVEKLTLKFEDVVVKQGSPVNGLHFLVSGQVKIRLDPGTHPTQFPQHFAAGDIADLEKQKARELLRKEMNLQRTKSSGKRSAFERRSVHHEGRRHNSQKPIELCLMSAVDTIGDLEMVLNLPTYSQTVVCTEAATIYHLDQRNYDRLVEKKNPQTVELMRDIVHTKLTLHFSRLHDDAIPMYRYLLYTLDDKERDRVRQQQQRQQQQAARGKQTSTAATETTQFGIDSLQKGPLVNLYGPGSVFHWIRTKAKERQQRQQRALNANPGGNNAALRFGQNQYSRTPLADTRFYYEDDTASIKDGHIVNIYGYNDSNVPYEGEMEDEALDNAGEGEMYEEYYEEDEDWATSELALSNLEERLMRWHNSFGASGPRPVSRTPKISTRALSPSAGAPVGQYGSTTNSAPQGKGDKCVVKLHRFHFDEENKPKPGNKVYVRERQRIRLTVLPPLDNAGPSLEPEIKGDIRHLSASPSPRSATSSPQSPSERLADLGAKQNTVCFDEVQDEAQKPAQQKRPNSASNVRSSAVLKPFKKSKSRHQFTAEEYQILKEELRRRQKAYKSFLPHRSNTVL